MPSECLRSLTSIAALRRGSTSRQADTCASAATLLFEVTIIDRVVSGTNEDRVIGNVQSLVNRVGQL